MKFAYIMRGIPGSGKSTVAKQIAKATPGQANRDGNQRLSGAVIHSTDDLCFNSDGEYEFNTVLAPGRHRQNLSNFKNSLDKGVPSVICDNTNIKVEQYAPYVEAAQAAGYKVVIVELVHPTLDEAVEQNSHGVPRETINQMFMDWEPSQHCITVSAVEDAYDTVRVLQQSTKGAIRAALAIGFATGSAVGALLVTLAWLISP